MKTADNSPDDPIMKGGRKSLALKSSSEGRSPGSEMLKTNLTFQDRSNEAFQRTTLKLPGEGAARGRNRRRRDPNRKSRRDDRAMKVDSSIRQTFVAKGVEIFDDDAYRGGIE